MRWTEENYTYRLIKQPQKKLRIFMARILYTAEVLLRKLSELTKNISLPWVPQSHNWVGEIPFFFCSCFCNRS